MAHRRWHRPISLLAATFVTLAPQLAPAWICFAEPPGLVLPPPGVHAPRNARPVVRLPVASPGEPCVPLCAEEVETFELHTSPAPRRAPGIVAVDVSEARAGGVVTFVLRPRAVLAADRRHAIVALLRPTPDRPAGARRLVGSFRTSLTSDHTPPVWSGFRSFDLIPFRPLAATGAQSRVVVISLGPRTIRTHADVWGRPAIDAETPPDVLTYAVRVAGPTGVVDPAAMPRGFFRGELDLQPGERHPHRLFWLGQVDECAPHTFDFPPTGTLTLGVTATDLAGNESAMFVHTVVLDAAP